MAQGLKVKVLANKGHPPEISIKGKCMRTTTHASEVLTHPQFLNVTELAAMLKVKARTIYEMVGEPYPIPQAARL
jgi:hypothetical protein